VGRFPRSHCGAFDNTARLPIRHDLLHNSFG
jgi:hypothetical protein